MIGAIAALAPIVSKLIGKAAGGAADARAGENQFSLGQDQLRNSQYGTQQSALLQALLAKDRGAMDRYGTQQGATTAATQGLQSATSNALSNQSAEGLQRAQLGLQAPGVRAKQSIQTNSRVAASKPTISGGMSASALDPTTRQHGDELMKAALQAQLSGSDVPAATDFKSGIQDWKSTVLAPPEATDYSAGILTPPKLTDYKGPGKMESFLSGGALGGSILGEILQQILKGTPPGNDIPAGAG